MGRSKSPNLTSYVFLKELRFPLIPADVVIGVCLGDASDAVREVAMCREALAGASLGIGYALRAVVPDIFDSVSSFCRGVVTLTGLRA